MMNRHIHKDKHMSKSTLVDQDETVMPDFLLKFFFTSKTALNPALIQDFQVLVDIDVFLGKSAFSSFALRIHMMIYSILSRRST